MVAQASLKEFDSDIFTLIKEETARQEYGLEMIPSENFVSEAILEAMGSTLTNKYAEGTPGRRYYGGCEVVDKVEELAAARACELFGCEFANTQPHSGATANEAAYMALLDPGATIMGMRLDQGGHLTHGSPVNFSGKLYNFVAYGVRENDHLIDMDEVRTLARKHKPKLIVAGASSYSREIDFAGMAEIAREVGAYFMADIAHYAGLVAAGIYPSPVPHADIVTTTTHKTLRGPRSGLIMARSEHRKVINKAVFPGIQGGPHLHTMAAKAVAFKEALQPGFKEYAVQVVKNAQALSDELLKLGFQVVSGGTDSHMLVVDMRPADITGKEAEALLDSVGITGNKNAIPFDPQPFTICSGVRLGTPALTTRGMKESELRTVAGLIRRTVDARDDSASLEKIRADVKELSSTFPLYQHRLQAMSK
jgi:glycine hydroxymethyltransferase